MKINLLYNLKLNNDCYYLRKHIYTYNAEF